MSKEKKSIPLKLQITEEGSLGILALGAVGVTAWRTFKEENEESKAK